jgi:hypothetical protein
MAIFDAFLKRQAVKKFDRLIYSENVLLGMLEKKGNTGMEGADLQVPIHWANGQGVGGVFATAQSVASSSTSGNSKQEKLLITAGDYFGVVNIGDKVMEASRGNAGAFIQAKAHEIDCVTEEAGESLSRYTWGNGGNAIGQVATGGVVGNVITLTDGADTAAFEVGMYLVWSAQNGATSTDTLDAGSTYVTKVNREAGTIEVADATAGGSTLAAADYLFRAGDFNGDTGNVIIRGVQTFITPNGTTPGALWNISEATRLKDVQRFTGCRVPSAEYLGKPIEDRIRTLATFMTSRYKSKRFDAGFLNPEDWQRFETGMMSQGYRALTDDKTQWGYSHIELNTAGGKVKIYADRHCPKGHFFGLRMENFWMSSMGKLISPVNGDGLSILRKVDSMNYEYRIKSYPLFVCNAPLHGGRVPV